MSELTPREKTEIRNKRYLAAMNLEKPDRIPVSLSGQCYFKWIDPAAVIADIIRRPRYVDDLNLQAYKLPIIEEMDSGPMGLASENFLHLFGSLYYAKMRLPGRELPEDALWNIDEQGPMTVEDYDTVIDKGWKYVSDELFSRIGYDPAKLPPPDKEYEAEMFKKFAELGKATVTQGALLPLPSFEILCAARKMPEFFKDLKRMPDKVKEVIDIMIEETLTPAIKAAKEGPPAVMAAIGGTRAGSDFISKKIYEKYYHPFYQKAIYGLSEINMKVNLHNDSDWTGFLPYFLEFPRTSCIFDPDHLTPLETLKEVVGDSMCIEGNVPPSLVAVGTPDECYKETRRQMEVMGGKGFIMSVGCSVPANARRENIEAVILAVLGK